ncbi:MAG: UDP-N-acetylglucosamine--N-acetylmuramyl-(pentapeptide) pyrophosphoryl-undecaprenol N-acetylglucosamine transferase [Oscillospiraceae bacterium]|jgi:UDP-N-acetylglucosamine--N-acetylmuramyl-(pentapeptide) pyrophosphoryl-undecaprenol N-acetylglucosamine transferase|nr:UDP-N-acetylglucosamine--N-acetylmuramyl-(pentapeptide) pyrophosphoryl-undecaprenol N-acetylglucosamine transferase [Oscillospiraceae bacterium]
MKIVFTCGGTAGHVNPALALAGLIKERKPDSEILFVGARRGIEKQLIESAGWPFRTVEISSFHRSLTPKELRHNLISLRNLLRSPGEARALLKEFPASLVVGTGGYASYPMIRAAASLGIPAAVHESNAIPGLTTRLLEKHADLIMVGFEECRKNYRHPDKVLVTGTPVRGDFFRLTRKQAKQKLGMDDGRPLIVSFWGSLGAREMNRQMAEFLALEARSGIPFHHVHGAGKVGCIHMAEYLKDADIDLDRAPGLEVREYIQDMGVMMRAADLVICRAGASTISELTALGVPAIIVPSPNVTHNHQESNARVLANSGGAEMILEKDSSGRLLYDTARRILEDPDRRKRMSSAMSSLGTIDASEKIYAAVMDLRSRGRK